MRKADRAVFSVVSRHMQRVRASGVIVSVILRAKPFHAYAGRPRTGHTRPATRWSFEWARRRVPGRSKSRAKVMWL